MVNTGPRIETSSRSNPEEPKIRRKLLAATLAIIGVELGAIEVMDRIDPQAVVKAVKDLSQVLANDGIKGLMISTIVAGLTPIKELVLSVFESFEQFITMDNPFVIEVFAKAIKESKENHPFLKFTIASINRLTQIFPFLLYNSQTNQLPPELAEYGFLLLPFITSFIYEIYKYMFNTEQDNNKDEDKEEKQTDDDEIELPLDSLRDFLTRMQKDSKFANKVIDKLIEYLLQGLTILGPTIAIIANKIEHPNINSPEDTITIALSFFLSMTNDFLFEDPLLPEDIQNLIKKLGRIGTWISLAMIGMSKALPPAVARLSKTIYTHSNEVAVGIVLTPIVLAILAHKAPQIKEVLNEMAERVKSLGERAKDIYTMRN